MSATIEDSVVGRVVGPYRVLERIGNGNGTAIGTAIGTDRPPALYLAEHVHLDRKVALRVIASAGGGASSGLDRFLADARKLSRIRHDNVLGLHDVGQAGDGHIYLALDLPEGKSLDQVIAAHGPIAGARARIIGRQIGAVLVAAARESVLNRDVAPAEIFLSTKDGPTKDGHGDVVRIDLGTAELLAPDSGAPVDSVRVLGGLLYQMVVGRPPAAGEDGAPPDPMAARPDLEIPADLEVLIMRALDPDPTKRWPDIDAMMRMLTAAEQRASGPSTTVEQVDAPRPPEAGAETGIQILGQRLFAWPPSRALIAGCGAAAGVLILGIVLGSLGGARRDPPAREAAVASSQPPGAVGPAGRDQPGGAVQAAASGPPAVTPEATALAGGPFAGAASAGAAPVGAAFAGSAHGGAAFAGAAPSASANAGTTAATSAVGAAVRPPVALGVRAAGDGVAPRRDAGASSETRRGATGQGGAGSVAGAPSRDDEGKSPVAGRASTGDDACAVTLGSRPWSEVWIDGRQAGFTPLIDYPIDCGPHDVVFKSSESDIEKRVPIVVAPGQLFKKIVDLTGARPIGSAPAGAQKASTLELAAVGSVPAAAAGSGCLVTLGSRPWSEIWIDGKHVGVTPLVEYALPCGKHEVIFRSTDPEAERRETIVLQSGRTLKKVVTMGEAAGP